jgi:hypothetical protein
MTIPYIQIILLIVAVILIAACAPVSPSTSLSPTVGLRTPRACYELLEMVDSWNEQETISE